MRRREIERATHMNAGQVDRNIICTATKCGKPCTHVQVLVDAEAAGVESGASIVAYRRTTAGKLTNARSDQAYSSYLSVTERLKSTTQSCVSLNMESIGTQSRAGVVAQNCAIAGQVAAE
jgi:hypothetical protein